jgi:diguanylate cyclase (GGDEF)-like protein
VITAIVSLYTASELFDLIPKALVLPSPAQWEVANQKLAQEISDRQQTESALRKYQERLEALVTQAGERTVELTKLNEQLSWQATHDVLTGLFNRRKFEQSLEEVVTSARALDQEHTLCYVDLDRFKVINDTCGHVAGDELLRQVSALFQIHCRKTDTLARLGGDEFGLVLYQCPLDQALKIAQAMTQSIKASSFYGRTKLLLLVPVSV